IFAANTTDAPNLIAAPSIFTVAPNGKLKLATSSLMPAFFADCKESGNVRKLLVVMNAVVIASFVCLKNWITFTPNKRSEENTSELQSRFDLVYRLLLDNQT